MSSREPPRNLDGKRLTLKGTVDRRHDNVPTLENGGKAYARFQIHFHSGDSRPFVVKRIDLSTGEITRVSRHTTRRSAEKAAERERIKQPDRKASHKLKHVLGLA